MPVSSCAFWPLSILSRVTSCLTLALVIVVSGAQSTTDAPGSSTGHDALHLHGQFKGWAYQDDKIQVEAPPGWGVAYYILPNSNRTYGGVELRKEKYLLRLCTGCGQSSGVDGGRFSEIAGMVQPWFRIDPLATPSPCGQQQTSKVSKELERVDFWFRRDPQHIYNEGDNDCRQPQTMDTVWYGSYFSERCPEKEKVGACGGYFLEHNRFTRQRTVGLDQMVFAMTYNTANLNELPRQGDAHLQQVLEEASAIVKSVHFVRGR